MIVESIIGSILALLGDTFCAGFTSRNLFAVVLEKNPLPPGQKKLLRRASKALPSCRVLFFDIFGSEFPYTGLHFGTLLDKIGPSRVPKTVLGTTLGHRRAQNPENLQKIKINSTTTPTSTPHKTSQPCQIPKHQHLG